jgi:hypothetical protein
MNDECLREAEVVEEIETGRWPAASPAELQSHAASCAICGDVVAVAKAIRDECESARAAIRVPSAGLVWWRAQLRARQHVAETAGLPITYVHAAAAVLAACLLFTLGGLFWPWLRASVAWIDEVSHVVDMGRAWLPLTLAIGAWLVLAPVVFLFALSDE